MCGRSEPGYHHHQWVKVKSLQFVEALMRFFKEVGQDMEKKQTLRMQSKHSKLSLKERQYVFPPQKISKEDFQNLGKTSKKFGQSQAYQYSDKTSNQLSGGDK